MWCVTRTRISIMLNGTPTSPFSLEKGVRQGDPISSFLFAMVSKSLTYILNTANMQGLIKGVKVGRDHIALTRLQFTDDTLIFLSQNCNKVFNLRRLLDCYSLMTGLGINYEKSSLVSWVGENYE